ncbi:MAG: benzoate-CoA ligase family protein [Actinomycetia bacterium]|nr:benzoate-CoA ligase family protein [Actinomycetes bacterium]
MSANAVQRFVIDPGNQAPDRVAVIDAPTGQRVTCSQLLAGVERAAVTLAAAGLEPEQRVMLVLADRASFLHWFWGAMWIGAVPVPVSTMLSEKDYRFLLEDSRAAGLIHSAEFAASAGAASVGQPFLRWSWQDGDEEEVATGPAPDSFPAIADDTAFWLYTSGTTGFPKAAMHRHVDLSFCTDAYADVVLDMNESDVVYSVAKLFFAYGLGNAGYFPAATGATAVLNPGRPVAGEVAEHVRTYRPTLFFGVPTFFAGLLASELPADTFESLRLAVSAGEPLPADLHRRFLDRFGVEILDGIGTTELAHIFISNRPGRSVGGSTGTAVDGYEIEIRGEDGAVVPDGEPGQLFVAGESVMTGYWNRTDRNRQALQGRFLATGDSYQRNPDGTYICLGRTDDMLKVGGIWVSPAEVEACIVELPEVIQAAVVGATDDQDLVKPKAFVVPAEGVDREALVGQVQAHVKSTLAPYKYPRWVDVVDELPQTATGKIKRYLLR